MHKYTVELRFSSKVVDLNKISSFLNIEPREIFYIKKRNKLDSSKPTQIWAYSGTDEIDYRFEWDSLQEGLEFLFKKLQSKKAKIVELSNEFNGIWWCGHFQSSFDGGPRLTADFLAELASYKIPLYLDNYFSSDDDSEDSIE